MQSAFANYQLPLRKKRIAKHYWQEKAAEALEYLTDLKYPSVLFKLYQENLSKAESTLRYMKQRKITSFRYFAACLKKKPKN